MPDQMQLVITVRKPVDDAAQARVIFYIVKALLEDREDLVISGHCTNHFDLEEPQ